MTYLEDQLMRHEGYRQHPYKDTVGILTVGYGRNLKAVGVSKDEAKEMLTNDIWKAYDKLAVAFPVFAELSSVRRDVLLNMTFNLGAAGISKFQRMWTAIDAEDYAKAADEMLDSKWARQVGTRATELAKQMRTGER